MIKTEFELDIKGLQELMKPTEMQQILQETGASVADKASMQTGGENFGHDVRVASYVALGTVFPQSEAAAKASYQDNVLEKSLSGLPRTKGSGR